ncbi:MAG: cytidylate kinase [Candidatus Nanohaloarchaea archaeon]|jgi:cytidylate kinase
MGSYIEEFQDDREKKSDLVITIDGPSGSGKGTLAKFVAEKLNLKYYSAGDFFRQIAAEKDLTVEELSERAGKEVDVEVDRRTLERGLNENCVIESRIASKVLGDYSDFRIYVTADLGERARRVKEDLENRENEEGGKDIEEVKDKIRKRDEDNNQRYQEYYGINMWKSDIYDLILDNTELSIEEQEKKVDKVLKDEFPERYRE